jgi:hypothetical protein
MANNKGSSTMILSRFATPALAALALLAAAPIAQAAESCSYTQKNMFAGPFKVCEEPIAEAKCTEIGKTDENSNAAHKAAACPVEKVVGTCDKGATKLRYYDGDPSGLEIGCGFQGGTWVKP